MRLNGPRTDLWPLTGVAAELSRLGREGFKSFEVAPELCSGHTPHAGQTTLGVYASFPVTVTVFGRLLVGGYCR